MSNKDMNTRRGLSKTQVIIIVGIIVILAAVSIVGFMLYKLLNKETVVAPPPSIETGNYVVDKDNLGELKNQILAEVDDGMFNVAMNTIWNFPSSSVASTDAYVANDKTNHKPIFFEVTLADTGDLIYTSNVLPVGTSLKKLVLEKQLEQGVYPVVCTYHLLDAQNNIASSLGVTATINILK